MSIATFLAKLEQETVAAVEGLFRAEVAALQPIATNLVASAETAIIEAAATGKLSSLGRSLGSIVSEVGVQAETASITAGAQSLLGAVTAAIAANPKTAAATTATPAA